MKPEEGAWACDVRISMPEPIEASDVLLDMGTHAFTANGLFHNISAADIAAYQSPTFAPPEHTA